MFRTKCFEPLFGTKLSDLRKIVPPDTLEGRGAGAVLRRHPELPGRHRRRPPAERRAVAPRGRRRGRLDRRRGRALFLSKAGRAVVTSSAGREAAEGGLRHLLSSSSFPLS